jgi:hypothetical protein
MTDKTLKQTIDKASVMAKILKPEQNPDEVSSHKSKDFDDASSKAIDFINGCSGMRGICICFPVAGILPDNFNPTVVSTSKTTYVDSNVLGRIDKAISLLMQSINEISTHPTTEDFRVESIDDLSMELQNIRAKVQNNTYQKYLTKRFTCVVIKIDLDITSSTDTTVTVEIARTDEIKNKSILEVIHGFTYYF